MHGGFIIIGTSLVRLIVVCGCVHSMEEAAGPAYFMGYTQREKRGLERGLIRRGLFRPPAYYVLASRLER